ncbi:hypothetical protein FACS189418_9150 [Clostridia bacterium]|nr:hypothetical protein FACS189418_9150 [Clostridia bacterium]
MMENKEEQYQKLGISPEVLRLGEASEKRVKKQFAKVEEIAEYNQLKVIYAMQKNRISDIHFANVSGYGYTDLGRDAIEAVFAEIFQGEAALVRPQIMSGTHALALAILGNLKSGDELLSVFGKPYDTLDEMLGIRGNCAGSFLDFHLSYKQVDLLEDNSIDFDGIEAAIGEKTKLVLLQRSAGYSSRGAFSIEILEKVISVIKQKKQDVICLVDNCYGEFVEEKEPLEVGADLIAGSLIKNAGGGLVQSGGYVIGKENLVNHAAYRLNAPGLGREIGANFGMNLSLLQGIFFAPIVVACAVKTAIFAADIYEHMGYEVKPSSTQKRSDIVQGIVLGSEKKVLSFCEGIQSAAAVDSFVKPEAESMLGYDSSVIMAAGAFVQGASIELSADAPMKEPYIVYLQGALTWYHGKLGVLKSVENILNV